LAAVKIEFENKQYDTAREILSRARSECNTSKVWMKSAILERTLHNDKLEQQYLDEALILFPTFDKLWIMRAQLAHRHGNISECNNICKTAVAKCPNSINLWLEYCNIEIENNNLNKARSILEHARIQNPKSDELWL